MKKEVDKAEDPKRTVCVTVDWDALIVRVFEDEEAGQGHIALFDDETLDVMPNVEVEKES